MFRPRDLILAKRARKWGARYSLRIILEARRAGIPVSLLFAFVNQESGFRNVFGHDPTIFAGAGTVTKRKYLAYKAQRPHGGMQGVGPCQLTWYAYQDAADRLGGCWKPSCNIRVAAGLIASLLKQHASRHDAIARYNGTGPAAERYADSVLHMAELWHRRLA